MLELTLLLLPVAAASGWFAALRSVRLKGAQRHQTELSPAYFKGLNYLLNEQPDKAIDVFVKMLEVDSDTVETHLALGSLFRRRGEVDRAIRIHQNLIARPKLELELRSQALLELARDYMSAGLFDRAESLFQELLDDARHSERALRNLSTIYQQEREWGKAVEVALRLQSASGTSMGPVIAQYYCELAESARRVEDFEQAEAMIREARIYDPQCVRATILQGDIALERGDCQSALRCYEKVESQNPDYIAEVVDPVLSCYRRLDRLAQLGAYLRHLLDVNPGIEVALALADNIRRTEGEDAAADFVAEQLRQRPDLRGLSYLIDLRLGAATGSGREMLLVLKDLSDRLLLSTPDYRCERCGFSATQMHWQCPSCKSWSSVKRTQTLGVNLR